MSDRRFSWEAFQDLDASEDAEAAVAWLGRAAVLPPVRDGKRRSYELLRARAGDRILDVGCGRGDDVYALSRLVSPGGEVVGVDSSSRAIEAARAADAVRGVDVRFEVASVTDLPFADSQFDACRCDRTLLHVADPHRALQEMTRVVQAGGVVVVSEARSRPVADPAVDLAGLNMLLSLFHSEMGRRGPWVGLMLPPMIAEAGLVDVRCEVVAGEVTDADSIASLYDLPRLSRRALAEGRLTPAEWEGIVELLAREPAAGRLKVVVETHLFAGHVPPAVSRA